jgi:hypothetical protein
MPRIGDNITENGTVANRRKTQAAVSFCFRKAVIWAGSVCDRFHILHTALLEFLLKFGEGLGASSFVVLCVPTLFSIGASHTCLPSRSAWGRHHSIASVFLHPDSTHRTYVLVIFSRGSCYLFSVLSRRELLAQRVRALVGTSGVH